MTLPMPRLTYDIEVYPNYFLAFFRNLLTKETYSYRLYNDQRDHFMEELRAILQYNTLITFNGNTYDIPLTTLYLAGASNLEMKRASDDVIKNNLMPWNFERKYGIKIPDYDHIDLIQVAFGSASLKVYGARLGTKKLQELPIHFNNFIMPFQQPVIDLYCNNDNIVTEELAEELDEDISLRETMSEEYGIDLRSKSDAQIAEQVIKSEYFKATGQKLKRPKAKESYKYYPPDFVFFQKTQLMQLYNLCTTVDFNISSKGAVLLPKELNKQIKIGNKAYKMGIGGLHSVDKGGSYYSNDEYQILDIDAASFYPYVILNGGFEPIHIGPLFTKIYRAIVERRIAAKKRMKEIKKIIATQGETPELKAELKTQNAIQESLKIVINGLFGKFGNRYSVVYSPDLMFHTTVTGQLCLFMLIEQFDDCDIQVISANTDGISIRVHKSQRAHLDNLIKWWEDVTGFTMEYTPYRSLHHRDVNNYIAVKEDGSMKGKGIFASDGIRKNPANAIIRDACMAFIKDGIDPFTTMNTATDITKFLTVQKVTGGAVKDDVALGATVRWYRSDATDTALNYVKNGNQVSGSECGMPMMDLIEDGKLPVDLDLDWYAGETNKVLQQIGLIE